MFLYTEVDEKIIKKNLAENEILKVGIMRGAYRLDNIPQLITIFVQWLSTDRTHEAILIDEITWKIN